MSQKIAPSPLYSILKQLKAETFSDLRVCLPGSIAGIDPTMGTVSVDVGVMQNVEKLNVPGGLDFFYPQLTGCPIFTLQGGGVGAIMPIKIGDECLVIFSDRAISTWFSSGQPTPLPSFRMHNIADGFALVGLNSLQKKLILSLNAGEGGIGETHASAPGMGAAVAINPMTHKVSIRNGVQNLFTALTDLRTALTLLVTVLNTLTTTGGPTTQTISPATVTALAPVTTALTAVQTELTALLY